MCPNAVTLDEGIRRLLEQCDREDTNPNPKDRYLYTSEIRVLLGVGPGPDYSTLLKAIEDAVRESGNE